MACLIRKRPISFCLQYLQDNYTSEISAKELFACVPPFELNDGHTSDLDFDFYLDIQIANPADSLRAAFDVSKSDNSTSCTKDLLQDVLTGAVYGGTPDLHYTVMTGTLHEVMALVERKPVSHQRGRDAFGHSALHVAIPKPQILKYLLRNGFIAEIEARDHTGMTPLMYAAATKHLESAKILLDYGANPWEAPVDETTHLNSIFWAACCAVYYEDRSVFTELLDHYLTLVSQRQARNVVDHCLERLATERCFRYGGDESGTLLAIFQYLLNLGADPNQLETNMNTFLGNAKDAARTKLVFSTPSTDVRHPNVRGFTLLMAIVRFRVPQIVSALLQAGADAKIKDKRGMSALHHVLERLMGISYSMNMNCHGYFMGSPGYCLFPFRWEGDRARNAIASSALLVQAGTGLSDGDSCICYCSPGGCTPLQKLIIASRPCGADREMLLYQLPWILELSLVMEHCGIPGILQEAVRIVVRQRLFEELEMTHTCCNSKLCPDGFWCGHELCFTYGSSQETVDLTGFLADMAEIQEEEEELSKQLESKLQENEVFSSHLNRDELLSKLADWAVELEAHPVEYVKSWDTWRYVRMMERITVAISHFPVSFQGEY